MICVNRSRERRCDFDPHIPPPSAEFSLTNYATTYETARDTYLQVCEKLEHVTLETETVEGGRRDDCNHHMV